MMDKKEATKYILLQLCNWYYDLNPSKRESGDNDLSILKSLKLIFFLCTMENDNHESLLDKGFNKFKALPLGPVETDIYDDFLTPANNYIDYKKIILKNISIDNSLLMESEKKFIDNCIILLKKQNVNLINEGAFTLVDLTHEWQCWINAFNEAKSSNQKSKDILARDIKESNKIYSY